MRTHHDHNTRDFLFALSVGFFLLLLLVHLGGCATQRSNVASSSSPTSVRTAASSGHIIIRVHAYCTNEPCSTPLRDGINFVAAKLYRVLAGVGVQMEPGKVVCDNALSGCRLDAPSGERP